jgi:hypothetical protein
MGPFQARADRCIVQKNGFLSAEGMEGEEFNSIFKFRFCCHDVKVKKSGDLSSPMDQS